MNDEVKLDRQCDLAPMSHAQRRLWFLDQLQGTHDLTYVVPLAIELEGALDEQALHAALNDLIERHEVLRTRFGMIDGEAVQLIEPHSHVEFERADLSVLPLAQRRAQAEALLRQEACTPFDLARGPLLRARLLRLNERHHIVAVTLHHIVVDGWSLGVMITELGSLYASRSGVPVPALPALPIQYADYAIWQHGQKAQLQPAVEYWQRKLAGMPQQIALPTDHVRPAAQSGDGARHVFQVPLELTVRLRELTAREPGATLFMTLLAGFSVLLGRASGQHDFGIGTPVANRTRSELEGLIGFFVNTLVLRIDLQGNPSFEDLLSRTKEMCVEAYAHQDAPFECVVRAVNPERSLSQSPLFQVMFALQNAPVLVSPLPGLSITMMEPVHTTAQFDLSLEMRSEQGRLSGAFEYSCALFERETIESMAEQFLLLLEHVCANPTAPLGSIVLLSERQRRQILEDFNDTAVAFPQVTLHQLVEQQVERTPDAPALSYEGQLVSYAELNRRANRLAHRLRAEGVGPDVRVGVAMDRCIEMVVSLLAVLKAGGAYVPIDPANPPERILFMLQDADPPVLLIQDVVLGTLPAALREERVCLCVDWDEDAGCMSWPDHNPDVAVDVDHLAYVIYTSGSTGTPKGAMNTHRGAVNRLLSTQASYPLAAADRMLQKTPLGFDDSMRECFWPLLAGAQLVIAKPGGHKEPDYLAEIIQAERITATHFVPSMLRIFLDEASAANCTSLRHVIVGGEALPEPVMHAFLEALPETGLYNLYGPTECGPDSTGWTCRAGNYRGSIPIGKPVANTRIYILDELRQPVPIGTVGELYIGGAQVGRGYLNREALTAERFVADPFAGDANARMYRTGDLARWLRTGDIEYLGRADAQVKLRGFRIELGEIEAVLLSHESVQEAAVLLREGTHGEQALVAYVASADESKLTAEALRQHLGRQLPEYMLPSAFVFMSALSLTPNGKLDRLSLPAPAVAGYATARLAPTTPTEQALATVFARVLGLPLSSIGADANFFELGGHSLLAIRLRSEVRRELRHDLALRSIFERTSLAALASLIDASTPLRNVPELIESC